MANKNVVTGGIVLGSLAAIFLAGRSKASPPVQNAVTLTIVAHGQGMVTQDIPGSTFDPANDTVVTLTAHPASGYVFDGWDVNAGQPSKSMYGNPFSLTMDNNYVVDAFFEPVLATISLDVMSVAAPATFSGKPYYCTLLEWAPANIDWDLAPANAIITGWPHAPGQQSGVELKVPANTPIKVRLIHMYAQPFTGDTTVEADNFYQWGTEPADMVAAGLTGAKLGMAPGIPKTMMPAIEKTLTTGTSDAGLWMDQGGGGGGGGGGTLDSLLANNAAWQGADAAAHAEALPDVTQFYNSSPDQQKVFLAELASMNDPSNPSGWSAQYQAAVANMQSYMADEEWKGANIPGYVSDATVMDALFNIEQKLLAEGGYSQWLYDVESTLFS